MIKLFSMTFLLLATSTFAMGEDKLGPNGGFIRMPGTFHIELKLIDTKLIHVYLHDIGIKNAITQNSSSILVFMNEGETETVTCDAKKSSNYFECKTIKEISSYKKIKVKAIRNGVKASKDAVYELPLKLK